MKQIKILFVEDDAGIREELASFLERYAQEGFYMGRDGEEGLALFHRHQPDIVISDIKMPKMTGIEMVKKIRETDPDIPVVFTTAHSDSAYFLEAIELQVDGYLLKPIELKQLRRKIRKIAKELALRREYESQKIIMNEIAHLQGSMLAVFDEAFDLLFLNEVSLTFWGLESMEEALIENAIIAERMVRGEGYFYPSDDSGRSWITEIQTLDPHKRIIALRSLDGESVHAYIVDITHVEESQHTIVVLSEITKIEEERSSYQKRVYIDDLTQVYSRAMFDKELDGAVKKVEKEDGELSMILLDIDHFKEINDKYGHTVGDEILIGLSGLVKAKIRAYGLFARWGGDEFVLLLPGTNLEMAGNLAENLRKRIASYSFYANISLTCSFGVATVRGREDIDLFKKADEALYRAKLQGRNKAVLY